MKNQLLQLFEQSCQKHAGKPAIISGKQTRTYAQLAADVNGWRRRLADEGVRHGQTAVVALQDPIQMVAVWYAVWQLGGLPVPFEADRTQNEQQRAAAASQADWLITTENIVPRLPARRDEKPDDIAFLFYTSGTTGVPKCVMYGHQAIMADTQALIEAFVLTAADVLLTPLSPALPAPLAMLVFPGLAVGATLILPPHPLPGSVLRALKECQATVFFAVPYFYSLLTSSLPVYGSGTFDGVRLCLTSSAYLPPGLFDQFFDLTGQPIRSVYCSTEGGSCTFNAASDPARIRDTVGTPLPGVQLKIVNDQGDALPPGEIGHVLVSGTHLSSGYLGQPELNRQIFQDGWVHTGDLGALDAAGMLRLAGRHSDTINVSGYLVTPSEVEQVLLSHPAVCAAVVYGQPHEQIGEVVAAAVVVAEPVTEHELIELCRATLSAYKTPRTIQFLESIPRGRYGKIQRKQVAAEGTI